MLLRCYPKITDFFYELFHHAPAADYRFLPVFSYGFFVACGFFAAATLAVKEMKRREQLGLMHGEAGEATVGALPSVTEMAVYFFINFVIFFKLIGMIAYQPELSQGIFSLKDYFLSLQHGSWIGGLFAATAITALYYNQKNKEKLPQPEKKKITIYPSDRIGDLIVIAAVLGVLGSNFFNYLENPGDYQNLWDDPASVLFSGLSVYGGLICAAIGFGVYAYWKKFSIIHLFDAVCPGFMLANGIGRLGCQVAGDGDWGVANLAPKPGWIPQLLWSDHYAHNIINADPENVIPNCMEEHCNQLVQAAYPTPIYEFLMCTAIFFILWSLRKQLTYKPGMLFFIFMILIGIQRYAIEQWRDLSGRDTYGFFGIQFRQSELISIAMVIIGLGVTIYLYQRYKNSPSEIRHPK